MSKVVTRKIIDLEWPTRYLLECGHAVAIANDASAADMQMPGQAMACAECSGGPAAAAALLTPFKAGEPINALTLNQRLKEIENKLLSRDIKVGLTPFAPDEPINAQTLNQRLDEIIGALG